MKKFLVFIKYQGEISVSRYLLPQTWSIDKCLKQLKKLGSDVVYVQYYDTFCELDNVLQEGGKK